MYSIDINRQINDDDDDDDKKSKKSQNREVMWGWISVPLYLNTEI